jgi:hemolysin III
MNPKEKTNLFRRPRESVNGYTHLGAAVAAAGGLIPLLIVGWGSPARTLSLAVYGLSLIALFSASAAYHMAEGRPKTMRILQKVDHSAIYLLIAGTYTPFCVIGFSGFWQWGMLAIIWTLAAVGIGVKIFITAPRWVSAGVYLIMGWLSVMAIGEMIASLPPIALAWLLAGGLLYSLGAVVYITRKLDFAPGRFGFHEVWLIFVILAAVAHYTGIFSLVVIL